MSIGYNVKHLRELRGWSRLELVRRLYPTLKPEECARLGQQIYQLERRSSRRSGLLVPLAHLFGLSPDLLINNDLTKITMEELASLQAGIEIHGVPGQWAAMAHEIATATEPARSIIDKVIDLDRRVPDTLPLLSSVVDGYLSGVNNMPVNPDRNSPAPNQQLADGP
ncbi:helix-turn-helix domain-containing protein [Burkholderia cenocepacia]|uniref:hypothetical protein n=1 Tax=Burkholderia cenocepacia TaxID=95486 RepID=UPI001BA4D29B|nr:hypothetical protein [Burkholderia cenocepacia]MEB2499518.1 hypothetical protein [Burkholderia cenocepacia]MEB2557193.1 hypothetical protein [Burkholderia cenocepacia]QUN44715.1 hypothetical protein KEH56_36755 [Burkholderia cenocepacia]QUO26125.1 hypothetical protein KEH57_04105 [Burkholderia cenocepacia]